MSSRGHASRREEELRSAAHRRARSRHRTGRRRVAARHRSQSRRRARHVVPSLPDARGVAGSLAPRVLRRADDEGRRTRNVEVPRRRPRVVAARSRDGLAKLSRSDGVDDGRHRRPGLCSPCFVRHDAHGRRAASRPRSGQRPGSTRHGRHGPVRTDRSACVARRPGRARATRRSSFRYHRERDPDGASRVRSRSDVKPDGARVGPCPLEQRLARLVAWYRGHEG
ncbi:hypothetical protein D187_007306 [Cystobacter fuscus DSM 2262]|uniref:Uncharacterized protein n=1 Tax=Cystobacter fuscus (strain ATCC 25194 / DSM 2262 / NBRC 100088 / M29) TaxID=1242864 RepID=S9P164_CYSF2|nr:hypothetical protein D187_007306 [Cystobacter fuscus DSM 2262]